MNILEQLYEGALNPADSVVYTDEYDCLQEKIENRIAAAVCAVD